MNLDSADFLGADIFDTRFISCSWRKEHGYFVAPRHNEIIESKRSDSISLLHYLYQQLKKNLEDARDFNSAGDFHYREMQLRLLIATRSGTSRIERLLLHIYKFIADFGESYNKLAVSLLTSMCISSLLLSLVEVNSTLSSSIRDIQKFAQQVVDRYPADLKMMFFALIPSGFNKAAFDQIANLQDTSRFLILFQSFLTLLLGALLVMAVRRRFRR